MSGGKQFPPLLFQIGLNEIMKILSVFVDESGKFQFPDNISRFYIVTLVFHDQSISATELIAKLDSDWVTMGYENFCFHAGPLIRKEKGYMFMPRETRTAIFSRMLTFARKMNFRFHCLVVDKRYVNSSRQIIERLQEQLGKFLEANKSGLLNVDRVKVYYDCGQAPVTKLLQDTFLSKIGDRIEFAQGVKPTNYKLFQLADLICTVKLISTRINLGMKMTDDEFRFFGGPRRFMRNVVKHLFKKEL